MVSGKKLAESKKRVRVKQIGIEGQKKGIPIWMNHVWLSGLVLGQW